LRGGKPAAHRENVDGRVSETRQLFGARSNCTSQGAFSQSCALQQRPHRQQQGQSQQSVDAQCSLLAPQLPKQSQGNVRRLWRPKQRTCAISVPHTASVPEERPQNLPPQCFDLAADDGDDEEEQFCPSFAETALPFAEQQFFDLSAGDIEEEEGAFFPSLSACGLQSPPESFVE